MEEKLNEAKSKNENLIKEVIELSEKNIEKMKRGKLKKKKKSK